MNVRKRILAIRLMERIDKNKKLAEKMGISINFVKKNKKEKN